MTAVVPNSGTAESQAFNLGVCRALFYAFYLWQMILYSPGGYSALPVQLWSPPWLLSVFSPPSESGLMAISVTFYLSSFFAILGLFSRFSSTITSLTGAFLFGVMNSYGHVNIHSSVMQLIAFIIPLSHASDRFSIDSLLKALPLKSPEAYLWPIRLSQVSFVALMFTAGLQKLTGNWLSQPAHNMEYWIRYKYYADAAYKGIELPGFLLTLTHSHVLMMGMAVLMVAAESLSPLILMKRSKWVRIALITTLFAMQLFLSQAMNTLASFPWLCAYFFFIPWASLLRFSK